ncbi:MAG: hypothetical protein KatS3mg082_1468 [Nitrospiraceae bacterium]|nr:MAG: hypothetical protein KatS3mg082_1468 [Nitrospiraceae bacterium]
MLVAKISTGGGTVLDIHTRIDETNCEVAERELNTHLTSPGKWVVFDLYALDAPHSSTGVDVIKNAMFSLHRRKIPYAFVVPPKRRADLLIGLEKAVEGLARVKALPPLRVFATRAEAIEALNG